MQSIKIELKNLSELIPADYNPRKDLQPGDAEYECLKNSIDKFGYVEPIIWNKLTGRVVGASAVKSIKRFRRGTGRMCYC